MHRARAARGRTRHSPPPTPPRPLFDCSVRRDAVNSRGEGVAYAVARCLCTLLIPRNWRVRTPCLPTAAAAAAASAVNAVRAPPGCALAPLVVQASALPPDAFLRRHIMHHSSWAEFMPELMVCSAKRQGGGEGECPSCL